MTTYCILVDDDGNPALATEDAAWAHPDETVVVVMSFPAATVSEATETYATLTTRLTRARLLAWRRRVMRSPR